MTHPLTAAVRQWAAANFRTFGQAIRWLHAHEPRADNPTFASVDQCLWWAFRGEIPTTKTTGVFKMAGRARDELWQDEEDKERAKSAPIRTRDPEVDRRPAGIDGVTQQSMILSFVRRLPVGDHLFICAKYAHGDEQVAARRALRDLLRPTLSQNVKPAYTVYLLICRYFGRVVVLDELADKFEYLFPAKDCVKRSRSYVRRMAGELEYKLKDMAASAEAKCFERFQQGGLIK